MLQVDQMAMETSAERNPDTERAKSAWTWCYLYDRTIDESLQLQKGPLLMHSRLRTGLAFWSRGPQLCYVGYSHVSQTGEAAARENFPYMLSPGGPGDPPTGNDSASLMQALMELTQVCLRSTTKFDKADEQIMTNAHDILYPSKGRTSALVSQGTYFKVSILSCLLVDISLPYSIVTTSEKPLRHMLW